MRKLVATKNEQAAFFAWEKRFGHLHTDPPGHGYRWYWLLGYRHGLKEKRKRA